MFQRGCRQGEHEVSLVAQQVFIEALDHHDDHDHADSNDADHEQEPGDHGEFVDDPLDGRIHAQTQVQSQKACQEQHDGIERKHDPSHGLNFVFQQFS